MALTDVLALILGGGAGTRLCPLTKHAVPIAGHYRLKTSAYVMRDGIVIVLKNATLAPGTLI